MHTIMGGGSGKASQSMAKEMLAPTQSPVGDRQITNSSGDASGHSVYWWLMFFAVFVLWGWAQHRHEKIKSELEPQNVQANLHNLWVITFAAVIGVVGGKILFTKVAAFSKNIPLVGRFFSYLAQLFSAA